MRLSSSFFLCLSLDRPSSDGKGTGGREAVGMIFFLFFAQVSKLVQVALVFVSVRVYRTIFVLHNVSYCFQP